MSKMSNKKEEQKVIGLKDLEVTERKIEVHKMRLQGYSLLEISEKFKVDIRTISRDIQTVRADKVFRIYGENIDFDNWSKNQLGDYIVISEKVRGEFLRELENTKDINAKIKILNSLERIEREKIDVIKTIVTDIEQLRMIRVFPPNFNQFKIKQ